MPPSTEPGSGRGRALPSDKPSFPAARQGPSAPRQPRLFRDRGVSLYLMLMPKDPLPRRRQLLCRNPIFSRPQLHQAFPGQGACARAGLQL